MPPPNLAGALRPGSRFIPTLQTPLAKGIFESNIDAMSAYYKTTPRHAYPLSSSIQWIPGLKLPKLKPDVVKPINEKAKNNATAWLNGVKASLDAAIQKLQQNNDINDWENQIDAAEQKAQDEAKKVIHDYFEDIKQAGKADPALQPQLLKQAQNSGSFLTNLARSVVDFFQNIFNKVKEWIAAAVAWVVQAAKDVADWVSGAVDTVADFFGF